MDINEMPLRLATIYTKANNLLNSHIKATKIEQYTGINHSTIYRLRNGNRTRDSLTLRSMLLLANYPNKKLINHWGQRVSKSMYNYYLSSAAKRYHIDFNDIRSKFINVLLAVTNVTALAHKLNIPRNNLSHIRQGLFNVTFQHIDVIAKLLNEWRHLVQRGMIIPKSKVQSNQHN